ncbi:hypothetical protein J7L48_07885 [bacterium]|nr:hypothetical protein [bacterium]
MLPDKYRKFRRKILSYLLIFLFLSFITLLVGGLTNLNKSVLFLNPSVVSYFVSIDDPEVQVKVRISFTSRGNSQDKIFTFPLHLPENTKLEGYSIKYPFLLKDKPINIADNILSWHGILPQKGQSVVFILSYHYSTIKNRLELPLGTIGMFIFKDTFTDIRININGKLRDYESNYEFKTTVENFHTKLHFADDLNKKNKDLLLKW